MIILADSRDPIFNSRHPNRVPETPLKKLILTHTFPVLVTVALGHGVYKNGIR